MEALFDTQDRWYGTALLLALIATLVWESLAPFRTNVSTPIRERWSVNGLLIFLNVGVLYLLPITTLGAAFVAQTNGLGLLLWLGASPIVAVVAGFLVLDLCNYGRHSLMHRLPWLWRLHRAHHSDPEMDVSTSLRFHPAEAVFNAVVDLVVILLCGVPPFAVVLYRVFRIAISTLVHGNVGFPASIEAGLRMLLVTPDLHRIHHSARQEEHNCNFSGGLIWWDRWFGTYRSQSVTAQETMALGLPDLPRYRVMTLQGILLDPLHPPISTR